MLVLLFSLNKCFFFETIFLYEFFRVWRFSFQNETQIKYLKRLKLMKTLLKCVPWIKSDVNRNSISRDLQTEKNYVTIQKINSIIAIHTWILRFRFIIRYRSFNIILYAEGFSMLVIWLKDPIKKNHLTKNYKNEPRTLYYSWKRNWQCYETI